MAHDSDTNPTRWLTVSAAVKYSSIGRRTMFRLIKEGAVESHLLSPRKRLVDRLTLDAYIRGQPAPPEVMQREQQRQPHSYVAALGMTDCDICGASALSPIRGEWE